MCRVRQAICLMDALYMVDCPQAVFGMVQMCVGLCVCTGMTVMGLLSPHKCMSVVADELRRERRRIVEREEQCRRPSLFVLARPPVSKKSNAGSRDTGGLAESVCVCEIVRGWVNLCVCDTHKTRT